MKDDSPTLHSPLPDDERFVSAALEEHARLGSSRNDEALIKRILLETVNKESPTLAMRAGKTSPWKSLMIGATAAAAVLTFGVFFLQSFQIRDAKRSEQEVHFVVRILNDSPAKSDATVTEESPAIAAQSSTKTIEPTFAKVDAIVRPIVMDGNYLLETRFGKSLSEFPAQALRHDSFLISAEEVAQEESETRFSGQVVIAHDTWRIEAANASVPNAGNVAGRSNERSPFLSAFDVVVRQENPDRTIRAEELTFDAVSGNIVLTGVHSLSVAEGDMTNFQASDRLTLTGNSYAIESMPSVKYASPRLMKPGQK